MKKGKRVTSENLRIMVLIKKLWNQRGDQNIPVILAINPYLQIQNKLMQNHLDVLKSRYEDFADGGFSAVNAANVLC